MAITKTRRPRSIADILTQFLLPLVGLGLMGFAGWYVMETRPVVRTPLPPIEPARSPYGETVAASGIVEAQTENISVGSATPGVVVEVLVRVGDEGSPRRSVSATSLYSEGIADLSSAGTPRSGVPASLSHTPTLPHFGMSNDGAALR